MWTPSSAQGSRVHSSNLRREVALPPLPCAAQRHRFLEKHLTATCHFRTLHALQLQSTANTRVMDLTRYAKWGQTHVNANLLR
jgi:hypothetical protein